MAESETERKPIETVLYKDIKETQWPIIYSPEYNISFLGLEKLHPFDAGKWGRVYEFLKEGKMIRDDTTVRADEAQTSDLMVVHPKRYVDSLKWSVNVAGITEVPPVALLPNFIVQRKVLKPFRFQTGGTILAAKLAIERGWGINIGGGFHHCCASKGGGFCAYADITLAIKFLFALREDVKKVMIVDLDAHQGNGHERDFMNDGQVYIMDMYNRGIYPHDGFAKRAIRRKVELQFYTGDEEYLRLVKTHLEGALNEFEPDLVVYNAGTDILEGDPLGCLSITPQGIIERDQIVFQKARTRNIPVMMVTSGGYQKSTARIIADSLLNLRALGLISCDAAEDAPLPPELQVPVNLPRSTSEGGIWAKFKNCANMTRSSTSENLAVAGTSGTAYSPTQRDNSRSPSLRSKSTNVSPCMNRSKTEENMKQFENMDDDEFLEETLDFRSMLEDASHLNRADDGKGKDNENKSQNNRAGPNSENNSAASFYMDSGRDENVSVPLIVVNVDEKREFKEEYDSSPYDSEDDCSEGNHKEDNDAEQCCPSYDDFLKQQRCLDPDKKESLCFEKQTICNRGDDNSPNNK